MPSFNRPRSMRAASHIDFRTAVKMSQQASACSGFPSLTPLPTYGSQVVDECCSYPANTDQDIPGYTSGMEANGMPISGRLTPQTPEATVYHEPVAMGDMADTWMITSPCSHDPLASFGLGFEDDMTGLLPTELWSNPGQAHSAPITQIPWVQSSLSVSPQSMTSDSILYSREAPSLSISECSVEDFNNYGVFHEDWADCQPTTTQFDITEMTNLVTSAPFMHDFRSVPSIAPIWEDVFMPGSAPY
jgi:hypothetical protein